MSKPSLSGLIAIVGLFSGALALAQEQQPQRPQPATSETEGTAADRTQPGRTPTEDASTQTQNPRPSTSETEGTAADRTPPGKTPTTGATQSELVGAAVVSKSDAPLGKVVDVVFDSKNQPAFVVISSGGTATAVPFAVANSMMSDEKLVIDQSRLKAAPKIKQGEWRSEASSSWKQDATRYWDRG
jgi:cytoskeletal protein RodZ